MQHHFIVLSLICKSKEIINIDVIVKNPEAAFSVIPRRDRGIQSSLSQRPLDSGLHRSDDFCLQSL